MHIGRFVDAVRVKLIRDQSQYEARSDQMIVLGCVLALWLFAGCAHTSEVEYLSAAEIRGSIIGNSLREAESDEWELDFLVSDGDKLDGHVRARQKTASQVLGTWSIAGDLMCMKFPEALDQDSCYRFYRGRGDSILWFDEDGVLVVESELIERDETRDNKIGGISSPSRMETVTFQHGANRVVGDLSLPTEPAPYPAVVFVHG
jgi:hypothetical protein